MKKSLLSIIVICLISFLLSSCAALFGGSNYNAYVKVGGHPDAKIYYKDKLIGTGTVNSPLKIARKDANMVSFKVSKEGCEDKAYDFHRRVFRGWAFVGSLMITPLANGIPIPIPTIIDVAAGAYHKPDKNDPSISKGDYNNYYYHLDYICTNNGIPVTPAATPASSKSIPVKKEDKLIELKELFDKGMISEEEYNKARQEILSK